MLQGNVPEYEEQKEIIFTVSTEKQKSSFLQDTTLNIKN